MARFVLTPCHIREDRVVPSEDPVTLDWPEVAKLLAPSRSYPALMTLRRLRVNAFVGVFKSQAKKPPTNFLFQNTDRSNGIGWLLKTNPEFSEKVERIYRVEEAQFDAKFEEFSAGKPA
jgi:hypothetical protein